MTDFNVFNVIGRVVLVGILSGIVPAMFGYYAFEHWQFWPFMIAINALGHFFYVRRK